MAISTDQRSHPRAGERRAGAAKGTGAQGRRRGAGLIACRVQAGPEDVASAPSLALLSLCLFEKSGNVPETPISL